MSRIDELIATIDDMGVWDFDEYGEGRNYIDPVDKQVIIEELEQLRPYVEFYDSSKLVGVGTKDVRLSMDRGRYDDLIQQIKEQET